MFKRIVFFFLLTFLGSAVFVFALSTDGKVVDMFGKNVTVSLEGASGLKVGDKVDLSYMAGVMEMLIGQYEVTQVKGNIFIAKEISSSMPPSKEMKVRVVPAKNFFEGFGNREDTSPEPSVSAQGEKEEGFLDKLGQMFRKDESGGDNRAPVEGEVIEVTGRDVKIQLTSDGTPKVGDTVDLNYMTSSGKSLPVGTWQVKTVKGKEVVASPLGDGVPRRGLKAVIYKEAVQKKETAAPAASPTPWVVPADKTNRNAAATATAMNTYPVQREQVPVIAQNTVPNFPPAYNDFNSFRQAILNNQPVSIEQKWVLGVQVQDAQGMVGPNNNKFLSGVYVVGVLFHTPAQKVGILPGDIILHVDNIPVQNVLEFLYLINASDGKVVLNIKRSPDLRKAIIKTVHLKKFEASLKVGDVSELKDLTMPSQNPNQPWPQAQPQAQPQADIFQQQFPQVPVQQQWQGQAAPMPVANPQYNPQYDAGAQQYNQQQEAYNQALQQQQAAYNQAQQQQQAQQQAQQMQQMLKTMTNFQQSVQGMQNQQQMQQQQNLQRVNEVNGVQNFNNLFQGVNNNAGFSLDPKNYFPPALLNK